MIFNIHESAKEEINNMIENYKSNDKSFIVYIRRISA